MKSFWFRRGFAHQGPAGCRLSRGAETSATCPWSGAARLLVEGIRSSTNRSGTWRSTNPRRTRWLRHGSPGDGDGRGSPPSRPARG